MKTKPKSLRIGKDKSLKDDDGGLLADGESRILQKHWDKAAAKGSEAALLLALGLTDKREKKGAT